MFQKMFYAVLLLATLVVLATDSRVIRARGPETVTLSEALTKMDVVGLAIVEMPPPPANADDPDTKIPTATFKFVEVLKGQSIVEKTPILESVYSGDGKKGALFLIMGNRHKKMQWTIPLQISETAHKYLLQLPKLPKDGAERLVFFQNYLEDSEELLADDAHLEFYRASYQAIKDLKPQMNREQLVNWIKNPDVSFHPRRLYLKMLGVCGDDGNLPMLREMLMSSDSKQRAGLDGLVACYLILIGPDGMTLIEDQFLKNAKAEYADTYAAILALRFHATEANVIPKERLLVGFRHMLDRPELADLVIPDLARFEDWSSMERLVELFKKADEKTNWVKIPTINYLRACPLPIAKDYIKELKKLDPESVDRAHKFFPVPSDSTKTPNKP